MSKAKLYQKIIAVMNEVGQLQKDGDITDKQGKHMYSYLSEEQTTGSLQRAFVKIGLVMFPMKVESELITLETTAYEKTTRTPITKVIVTYKICDSETGESEEIEAIGYGSDSQDKGSNKAMTGAFKYAQRQTFMISTGDDGDHIPSAELDGKQTSGEPKVQNKPDKKNTPTLEAIKAKWEILYGSLDLFDDWYKGQSEKYNNNQIDTYLAKKLVEKNKSNGAA